MCIRQVCRKYILVNVVLDLDSIFACYTHEEYTCIATRNSWLLELCRVSAITTQQKSVGLAIYTAINARSIKEAITD